MRRQRQRDLGDGVLEDDRVAGERVERRRLDALVTVGREVVGAKRVHTDQDDRRVGEDIGLPTACGEGRQEKERDEDEGTTRGGRAQRPPLRQVLDHLMLFKRSFASAAWEPLGSSSRHFWRSAFASGFFFNWSA